MQLSFSGATGSQATQQGNTNPLLLRLEQDLEQRTEKLKDVPWLHHLELRHLELHIEEESGSGRLAPILIGYIISL